MPLLLSNYLRYTRKLIPNRWKKNIPGVQFLRPKTPFMIRDPWNKPVKDTNLRQESLDFNSDDPEIKWNPAPPPNWKSRIQFFNYIHVLDEEDKLYICNDWIDSTKRYKGDAWDPYAISLRLVNWIIADLKDNRIIESMYNQAEYLFNNTEFNSPGLHYIANAKALVYAGLFFNNFKWLDKGKTVINSELPRIIPEDGGFYNKSITQHSVILQDLLDIINIYPDRDEFRSMLREYASLMLKFSFYMTDSWGRTSMFSDCETDTSPDYDELRYYSEKIGIRVSRQSNGLYSFRQSGFYGIKDANICLNINGGGTDISPLHNDLFSYELSVKGEKFITDSGFNGDDDYKYFRRTSSHNTIVIDEKDQSLVYQPEELLFEEGRRLFFNCSSKKTNDDIYPDEVRTFFFSGIYRGFGKIIGDNLSHKRDIYYDDSISLLTIKDTIEGGGKHTAKSYIHLQPGVYIKDSGQRILIKNGSSIIVIGSAADYTIVDGWHSPSPGRKTENKVIVFHAPVPCVIEYKIKF
jgi:hypothetical protein